jgi:hypothetical protein
MVHQQNSQLEVGFNPSLSVISGAQQFTKPLSAEINQL